MVKKLILRSMWSLPENARMDREGSADVFLFEGFRLDRRGGVLYQVDREGVGTPVPLGSRAFNLLSMLIERKGELVSKDEDHERRLAGSGGRGSQPQRPDFEAPPDPRCRPSAG